MYTLGPNHGHMDYPDSSSIHMSQKSLILIYTDSRHSSQSSKTCRIVSKLKVRPFQRVNSPLDVPVTKRRPSVVHWELISLSLSSLLPNKLAKV